MSQTEISGKGVSTVTLIDSDTLFTVSNANVDKKQGDSKVARVVVDWLEGLGGLLLGLFWLRFLQAV